MGNVQFIYRNLRIKLVFIINDYEKSSNQQNQCTYYVSRVKEVTVWLVNNMGNIIMCNLTRTSMDYVRRVVYSSLSLSYISRVSTFEQLISSHLPHAD